MLKFGVSAQLGEFSSFVETALTEMERARIVERIWEKDHRLWKPDPREIVDRLGWLQVPEQMQERVGSLQGFARSIRDAGFQYVVLLGMGGSSLGPEVLRRTFGSARGYPMLLVLDSTVPGAVRQVARAIRPQRTLFIVASKSGGTIEVMSLFAYFWNTVKRARGNDAGDQFVAITDPGTGLQELAQDRGFRTVFTNPPDIGGRYSVLSYFGLVPAALLGLDLERLLARGMEMARACGPHHSGQQNPGAHLGVVMGTLAQAGRDKVTIITSPSVESFGLWAEQLLAESTGKEGKGLIPIANEPMVAPDAYGQDRLFVYLRVDGDANSETDLHVRALERAGCPVVRLTLRDQYDLAAEFYRWEFATAVAGHYLGIHPFDQPNVQESKENTGLILNRIRAGGQVPAIPVNGKVSDLLAKAAPGQYLAILAYLRPSAQADAALHALRRTILTRYRLATTVGYGPRYLHSTGQLHKGGPNTGLFLQLIEPMTPDLKIPGEPYTFGMLARAQALGDFQSLQAHGRPVIAIRLGRQGTARIRALIPPAARRSSRLHGRSRTARRR